MAKHPNWSTVDPAYTIQDYYTATGTSSGYWTHKEDFTKNFVTDRGVKSYVVTPGYASPKRNTLIKPLAYTATYETYKGDHSERRVEYRTAYTGNPATPFLYLYGDSSVITHNVFQFGFRAGEYDAAAVDRKAIDKLLENLKDQKVNLAQAFAEREETVRTVVQTVRTVAATLTNLRKGNFVGAAKALGISPPKRASRRFIREYANNATNAVGNGWLALQYGWKPLLQDVYGAAETLAQASLGPENRNAVYAETFGQSKKKLTRNELVTNSTSGFTGYDKTLYQCRGHYLVRYGVRYTRSSAPVSSLAKVGILNPLQLAWELVPYSFVVDWFLPIGNWLGGLDASAGLAFESGYRTVVLNKVEETTRSQSITNNSASNPITSVMSDNEYHRLVQMTRTTLGSFPLAPAPRFKNPLSMSHLASAFALLKQFKR